MNHQQALTKYIASFISELVNNGIEDVVVSPGSRSTPMAMVMAEHPELRIHIHVDERSAAFFALGMAKASSRPVAILCTSGTAAANYYPAIVEAFYSRVPLIVLTADRPHELRDVGAPQAIDQLHLYGKHVKWFIEMAPPEDSEGVIRYVRTACARAAATAKQSPAGPVHMNFPFREPLIPDLNHPELFSLSNRKDGYITVEPAQYSLQEDHYKELAAELGSYEKGMIICGPIEEDGFTEAVISLAESLNYPILADPLSQLRSGQHRKEHVIDAYDSLLKNETAKQQLKPDVIIRFGAMPVSKPLLLFLKSHPEVRQIVIDGGGGFRDPALLSTDMIYCQETLFCKKVASYTSKSEQASYLNLWREINTLTKEQLRAVLHIEELNEGKIFAQLAELLPEGATVFVGNSMPIRDLDTFFHVNNKSITVMANRGANGIDGTVSTALGAAMFSQPLYLIVGDLTFFHDLNGLIASKLYHIPIHIIVINNNGGGIFSFLPQAEHPKNFELLFGTPLNINFEHSVKMFGGKYEKITDWVHFSSALLNETDTFQVLELVTKRDKNVQEHRDLWDAVSREISRLLEG
ncbi:2-succinyl-5-enolpyruvyl-6-hydroxy-3-cyclohexene-1-carboxylic-acid synthase [Cytobacillus horneckiae]|uniref:2-succinyl-5-enolpyruvyl-6-hydroxy-3- cyclohexene-1-carboxylic-acid synthase n=1 Tax=Cytobacillus horneckiae TaxID=549687 RepID=UPI0039A10F6B